MRHEDTRKYSQHHADVLNLETNALETVPVEDLLMKNSESISPLAVRDREVMDLMRIGDCGSRCMGFTFDNCCLRSLFPHHEKTAERSRKGVQVTRWTSNPRIFTGNSIFRSTSSVSASQTGERERGLAMPERVTSETRLFESQGNSWGASVSAGGAYRLC